MFHLRKHIRLDMDARMHMRARNKLTEDYVDNRPAGIHQCYMV